MNSKQGLIITVLGMGLLMNSGCAAVLLGGLLPEVLIRSYI